MLDTMKTYRYRLSTLLFILFTIGLGTACGNSLIPVTGNDAGNLVTLSECYQVRFLGLSRNIAEGSTTWQYQVEELPCAAQDLSEWILEIPVCATILEASPSHWEAFRPDSAFQENGIKWKMNGDFQGGIYSVTLSGMLMRGPIQVGVNGANATGVIQGPLCDPNAPTYTVTFTPTLTLVSTLTPTNTVTISPTGSFVSPLEPIRPARTRTFTPATAQGSTGEATTRTPTSDSTKESTPDSTTTPVSTAKSTSLPTESTPAPTNASIPALTDEITPVPTNESISALTEEPLTIPTELTPTATIQSGTSSDTIEVIENDEILTYSCNGDAVKIRGNVNVINLVGSCSSITITGNNNRVYWESGSPTITDTGSDNSIDQK